MLNLNEIKRLDEVRNQIANDVESFLAQGGIVRKFDSTVSSENALKFGMRKEQYDNSREKSRAISCNKKVFFSAEKMGSIMKEIESGVSRLSIAKREGCSESTLRKNIVEFKGGSTPR